MHGHPPVLSFYYYYDSTLLQEMHIHIKLMYYDCGVIDLYILTLPIVVSAHNVYIPYLDIQISPIMELEQHVIHSFGPPQILIDYNNL